MSFKRFPVIILKNLFKLVKTQRARNRWRGKIKPIYQKTAARCKHIPLDVSAYKKKWRPLSKNVDTRWYKTFSYISEEEDINFVEEDIYYMLIEPALNKHELYLAYRDKNFYDRYNASHVDVFPDVLLRNIEGVFCDKDYKNIVNPDLLINTWKYDKIVVKPSLDTGGGRNVQFFTLKNGSYINKSDETLSIEYLLKKYIKNFLIQDFLKQHNYFNLFNPTSLNTMRITTYRSVKDEKVHVLHVNLRMGGRNSQVDNVSAGGAAVHVNKDGSLNYYATDLYGVRLDTPPSVPNLLFTDIGDVPNFNKIIETITKIASNYYYFRMLGFDVTLDIDGKVRIIEINFGGLGTIFQWDSGSLFGEFTDEVIEYCVKYKQNQKEL